jgi:hypothetical protein
MEQTGLSKILAELKDLKWRVDTEQAVATDICWLLTTLMCSLDSRLHYVQRMFLYKQTGPCQFLLKVEISLVCSEEIEKIRF